MMPLDVAPIDPWSTNLLVPLVVALVVVIIIIVAMVKIMRSKPPRPQ